MQCETVNSNKLMACEVCNTTRIFSETLRKAKAGDVPSLLQVAEAYYNGKGVKQDYLQALTYYQETARRGEASAIYMLGESFYYGRGVEQDYVKGVKYYQEAARRGSVSALYMLGESFYHGRGVEQDYVKGVKYYQEAARRGCVSALYMLGESFYSGRGVEQDYVKAIKFYREAADKGDLVAKHRLKSIQTRRILRLVSYMAITLIIIFSVIFGIMKCLNIKRQQEAEREQKELKKQLDELDRIYGVKEVSDSLLLQIFKDMIFVEGGSYEIGESAPEQESQPSHSVILSSFYLCKHEVTQEEWAILMDNNPSVFKGKKRPVENVTWEDCQNYIRKLNHITKMNYRLPTEAEWEYAARGGKYSPMYRYSDRSAWFKGNSQETTHDVMTKCPNGLDLYDMCGNVAEFCSDRYGDYSVLSQKDPQGATSGTKRVIRGKSWGQNTLSITYRQAFPESGVISSQVGFRLAMSDEQLLNFQ